MAVGGHLGLAQPPWIDSHLGLVAILDWTYTYDSEGIVYREFYLSLFVPHLCLKSVTQGHGRLSWIGGHLGLAAILDWQKQFRCRQFPYYEPYKQ